MNADAVVVPQTPPPAPMDEISITPNAPRKPTRFDSFRLVLVARPALRNIALVVCVGLIALGLVIVWFAWFKLVPDLWNWAFTEFSLKSIVGGFGVFFLAVLPVYAPLGAFLATAYVVEIYADEAAKKVKQTLEHGSAQQANAEDELALQDKTG